MANISNIHTDILACIETLNKSKESATTEELAKINERIARYRKVLSNPSPCIGKSELAGIYGLTRGTLNRFIIEDKDLADELEGVNYNLKRKYFTHKEVEIIRRHIR